MAAHRHYGQPLLMDLFMILKLMELLLEINQIQTAWKELMF